RPWSFVPVLNASGAQTVNDGVDFDLSLPRGLESDVLFSDEAGQVFISQDMATTPFNEITDVVGPYTSFAGAVNTYVVFDPGYGTAGDPGENMIYAAGGTLVGRCALSSATPLAMQDWVYISVTGVTSCDPFALQCATGIDAAGDTALYVSDLGYSTQGSTLTSVVGTIGVRYTTAGPILSTCDLEVPVSTVTVLNGTFQALEPLTILEYNLECQWDGDIEGTVLLQGLISTAMGRITIHIDSELDECILCSVDGGSVEVLYSYLSVVAAPTSGVTHLTGVWRTLNPMDPVYPYFTYDLTEWEFLQAGALGPNTLIHRQADTLGVFPDDLWLTQGSNMLWALDDLRNPGDPTHDIWMWDDPLAAPVIQVAPADGALLATTTSATISWDPLDAATLYEYFIFSYCPTCPDNMVPFENLTTDLTCIVIDGLTPGTTYYWKVRVDCNHPQVSKWSDLWTFNTALSSTELLCSPYCGEQDVILTPSFAWDAVIGATSYTIQVATDDAFTAIVTEGTSTVNAWMCDVTLDYDTSYYWQVQAVGANASSAWAPCIFHTAAEPVVVEPTPPVEVITNEITPTWIWVIIAIGGALTIAVVVLIVTTRRVP
ncbi:MAG: fibronectin type III domain-containing protein, partial [Chloroflexi bacterium]|nr:fibronectin type III domain-containing protein [Chloroflexota bacterium]